MTEHLRRYDANPSEDRRGSQPSDNLVSCKAALQRLYRKKHYTNNLEFSWIQLKSYVLLYPQNTSNIEGKTLKIEKLQHKVHALHHHTVNTHSGQITPCVCGAGAITHAEVERALTE